MGSGCDIIDMGSSRQRCGGPEDAAIFSTVSEGIKVVVNGEERLLDRGASILDLLDLLDLDPSTVVVELNREIVRQPALDDTQLNEEDCIELVHFVGGG